MTGKTGIYLMTNDKKFSKCFINKSKLDFFWSMEHNSSYFINVMKKFTQIIVKQQLPIDQ